ncbi:serine/threonine-protein phosphatase 2A activator 1 [Rhizoctonia solani AG-1 IA]|uniref:Serine/threonine-protein phosphatase 2A activator n=1 Tax=Thanatephorus cucumeris (strain AG1-IA) TaxID=983506 RepID=L8WGM8_THACA|nr:serine/threonine-protein phosphatase 2A activator 1 [Rhizoctonia solani AG-1 IA]
METPLRSFPQIPICDVVALADLVPPRPMIQTDHDIHSWQRSDSYLHLLLYIRRLGESVVGAELRAADQKIETEEAIGQILVLLEELESWIDDIPPQASPQRYGNLAFRDWGKRLEEVRNILAPHPTGSRKVVPHLKPYLMTSFGSFVRIDYGTGHELSFVVFLLCLHKLGLLPDEPEVDKSTVLDVFVKYLHLCWKLQDTYKLEPAGSHGVWGLDDYSFLGYYWGSAQLKENLNAKPSSVLQVPLPSRPSDLYTLSIARVRSIKSGPFHEHSPQLYSIASSVPVWSKVNSGLLKMYEVRMHVLDTGSMEMNSVLRPRCFRSAS